MSKHQLINTFMIITLISGALNPASLVAAPVTGNMPYGFDSCMIQNGYETIKVIFKKSVLGDDMIKTDGYGLDGFYFMSENQTAGSNDLSGVLEEPAMTWFFDDKDQLNCMMFTSGITTDSFGFTDVSGGASGSVMLPALNQPVPEPGALFLFGSGLVGLGGFTKPSRKNTGEAR